MIALVAIRTNEVQQELYTSVLDLKEVKGAYNIKFAKEWAKPFADTFGRVKIDHHLTQDLLFDIFRTDRSSLR